jgi:hypothetical protein
VRVQNIFTTKDVPWEVVRAVSFRDGSPWAVLELADDDQISRARRAGVRRPGVAVRGLRALRRGTPPASAEPADRLTRGRSRRARRSHGVT